MLNAELALVKTMNRTPIGRFFSMGEFVLAHGREFDATGNELPEGVRLGKMGYCFENAAKLATQQSAYTYCEGYAMGIIPVLHAWCVDANGDVVDPTWNRGPRDRIGMHYFGIAFTTKYLIHHLCEYEKYGLIDSWEHRWPLLRDKAENFIHPKFHNTNNTHEQAAINSPIHRRAKTNLPNRVV